jgi:hypothetical protein
MYRYLIQFYHGDDLRSKQTVTAYDDLKALAAALNMEGINEWIIHPAMRIEIRRA